MPGGGQDSPPDLAPAAPHEPAHAVMPRRHHQVSELAAATGRRGSRRCGLVDRDPRGPTLRGRGDYDVWPQVVTCRPSVPSTLPSRRASGALDPIDLVFLNMNSMPFAGPPDSPFCFLIARQLIFGYHVDAELSNRCRRPRTAPSVPATLRGRQPTLSQVRPGPPSTTAAFTWVPRPYRCVVAAGRPPMIRLRRWGCPRFAAPSYGGKLGWEAKVNLLPDTPQSPRPPVADAPPNRGRRAPWKPADRGGRSRAAG